jgi:DNA-binding LytR/AlgR family response regulator
MDAPTAIVAEDERVLRDELCQHLAQLWPELRIVGQAATGIEALQLLERHAPQVLLLDIEMPGLTGLEVAQQAQGRCHIVFVTAYDRFALAAFEAGAVDYVLKPLRPARLAAAVARLKQRVREAPPRLDGLLSELAQRGPPREYLRWINASQGQELRVITVDQVCFFQADAKYTVVATADGDALIRRPLKELQEQLDPSQFWTIHRSTIVNAGAIAGVTRDFRGRVAIRLRGRPEKLVVSEAHEHLFRMM